MSYDPAGVPIYINVRDRVTTLRSLVAWLEKAGHERITLIDNASTYPPLLDYLARSPHVVVRPGRNLGSRAIWCGDLVPNEPFVYTDPDVLPVDNCPRDAVARLAELLGRYPHPKAALGLYLDDTPDFQSKDWERSLVGADRALAPGVFDSLADTTFALYRPSAPFTLTALRTGAPYQCRHIPWYHLGEPDEEECYYLAHAIKGPMGSSWAGGKQ